MKQALTHDRIRIECPYPIQTITDIEFIHTFNEHACINIKGILLEEEQDHWLERVGDNDRIAIYGQAGAEEELLFSGCVTRVNIQHQDQVYTFEIEGLSYSHFLEDGEQNRSFQNHGMTYSEVIQQVIAPYLGARFISLVDDRAIGEFIIQYRENDWDFLRRIATHFQTVLTADIKGDSPRFFFGIPKNFKEVSDIRNITTKKDTSSYQLAQNAGLDVTERDFVKYAFDSLERLELGDRITFRGVRYLVEKVTALLVGDVLQFRYTIGSENAQLQVRIQNKKIQGVSILGEVLEAQNQALKLKLNCDSTQDIETACWFPYATQADNIFYCMPEEGSTLSLYFGNDDECSAVAVNAVRRNGGNSATMTNPNVKRLDTPYGNEMVLDEQDIHFSVDDGLSMTIDDGAGVSFESYEYLNIYSQQSIVMDAGESIEISSEQDTLIAAGSESQFYLESTVGDTNIHSDGDIFETGYARTAIPDFNEEIEVEEVVMSSRCGWNCSGSWVHQIFKGFS